MVLGYGILSKLFFANSWLAAGINGIVVSGSTTLPDDPCRQAVQQAYNRLSNTANSRAVSTPLTYRMLSETYYRVPGKETLAKSSRTLTMAVQNDNCHYTDGHLDVYSNPHEMVVIDRVGKRVFITNAYENAANNALSTIDFIRVNALANAEVKSCSQLEGSNYKKVILTMPKSFQNRMHVAALEVLLTATGSLHQSTLQFTQGMRVQKAVFTVLANKIETEKQIVNAPLTYVFRADDTLQPAIAQYHVLDQRREKIRTRLSK